MLDLGRLLLGLVVAFGVLFLLDAAGDKTDHSEPLPPDAPTLHVDALAVLGGVDIKHEK